VGLPRNARVQIHLGSFSEVLLWAVPNRTEPRTLGQWIRYVVVAIALFLVWWMLRLYVLCFVRVASVEASLRRKANLRQRPYMLELVPTRCYSHVPRAFE
jgi:hypothetical protein